MAFGDYERFCENVRAERDAANWERMKQGPRFDAKTNEIVMPAYYFHDVKTKIAARTWGKLKFSYDKAKHEWRRAIPSQYAQAQVAKARIAFNQIWGIA